MIRKSIISTGHLKKNSYNILKKYHDLADRKKFERIYAIKDGEEYCFVTLVQNLREIMKNSLSNIEDGDCKLMAEDYLNKLGHLTKRVEECANNNSTIHESFVTSVLKAHTNLFNRMVEVKEKFNFNDACKELWDNCYNTAYSIWNKF
ncbi:hypothetical protein [Abyssisolibacter fermentans]|uniref:hypothetical protein n=1 Tax=Abyssisolibacter fermentans TaxID=1766203 RepID=UPI000834BD3E|nr:hypothetical protein [Abyssisolibacter fermentans]